MSPSIDCRNVTSDRPSRADIAAVASAMVGRGVMGRH
jgi:hypothetical protein